jgi:hypothetical protein
MAKKVLILLVGPQLSQETYSRILNMHNILLVLGLIVASGRSFTMFMHLEQVWLGLVFSSNVSASNMVMGLVIVVILLRDSEASPWRTHDGEGLNTSKIICQTRCCQNAAKVHGLPYCGLSSPWRYKPLHLS